MRLEDQNKLVTLAAFALGAGVVLLIRFIQKTRTRKAMRDNAVETLRQSGEFFFDPHQPDSEVSNGHIVARDQGAEARIVPN